MLLCNAVEEVGRFGGERGRAVVFSFVTIYTRLSFFLLRSGEDFLTNISRSLQNLFMSQFVFLVNE